MQRWQPHVTVAALVQNPQGDFLLVEERIDGQVRVNQPAGHWERGESLTEAVVRETREETGYPFVPEFLVGIYHWPHPHKDLTYLRFTFAGLVGERDTSAPLDTGIIGPVWWDLASVQAQREHHRSPLVEGNIRDFLAGRRYPLDILRTN